MLINSLGIIFAGLASGIAVQLMTRGKGACTQVKVERLRKCIQKGILLLVDPIVYIGAIWSLDLEDIKYIAMPFVGIMALILGGVLAFILTKLLKMSRKQTGAFIICGGFTNIGSIGGLLCYRFLGETGFAVVSIYKLFEGLTYYAIGFPLAKHYSNALTDVKGIWENTRKTITDPFVLAAVGSLLVGFILNIAKVERPQFYSFANSLLIPLSSFFLLSTIGMALHISRINSFIFQGFLIAAIKFLIVPAAMTAVAYLVGFGDIDHGLPLKVVLILSSMPVGFTAIVATMIYDLDIDLANSAWIVTNGLLLLVAPLLYWLVQQI